MVFLRTALKAKPDVIDFVSYADELIRASVIAVVKVFLQVDRGEGKKSKIF